jgi:hypothetical protein
MTSLFDIDVVAVVRQAITTAQEGMPPRNEGLAKFRAALRTNSHLQEIDQFLFRYNEYEITLSYQSHLADIAEKLEWARPLGIAAAPEVVSLLSVSEDYGVLVSRYWSCAGEQLLPVTHTSPPLDPLAGQRLLSDFRTLMRHGRMHRYGRAYQHWLVGSVSGTIVLNAWESLRECDPDECNEVIAMVEFLLKRKGAVS